MTVEIESIDKNKISQALVGLTKRRLNAGVGDENVRLALETLLWLQTGEVPATVNEEWRRFELAEIVAKANQERKEKWQKVAETELTHLEFGTHSVDLKVIPAKYRLFYGRPEQPDSFRIKDPDPNVNPKYDPHNPKGMPPYRGVNFHPDYLERKIIDESARLDNPDTLTIELELGTLGYDRISLVVTARRKSQ